ncbi:MAG: hypothetical protein Q8R20_03210 [Nanoarchaeota archaeon]|nr:hypothetical protein [Nanoarchaeota archaeon]
MSEIFGLHRFASQDGLPQNDKELSRALRSPTVKEVRCFALGPEGTNISQANATWLRRMGVEHKSSIALCETPEDSLRQAREVGEDGVVPTFGTCAVYYDLAKFFFRNPDVVPFLGIEPMALDEMRLATRRKLADQVTNVVPSWWRIASHPSPSHLLAELNNMVVKADSNATAAIMCERGEIEACITTASAAALHGLVTIHIFGSPTMIFFYGTTSHGANVLCQVMKETKARGILRRRRL